MGLKRHQTDLVVVGDEAVFTDIHPVLKAEQIGHFPLGTLTQPHVQEHSLHRHTHTHKRHTVYTQGFNTSPMCWKSK